MKSFVFTIKDKQGIHARPAGEITAVAKKFKADTYLIHDGNKYDLKMLLKFIGSELKYGDKAEIFTVGSDENEAINALKESFNKNL